MAIVRIVGPDGSVLEEESSPAGNRPEGADKLHGHRHAAGESSNGARDEAPTSADLPPARRAPPMITLMLGS